MAVDIEAYQGAQGEGRCIAYLRYLFPAYRWLNEELLNLTYNTCGAAKDLPAILGLKSLYQPEGIVEINWDEALENVLSLLLHRDMIADDELLREVVDIAEFVMKAYRLSLYNTGTEPVVIKWSA